MIQTLIAAVRIFGIGKSIALGGVLLLALGTVYGVWHFTIWKRGYDRAIADIAAQDNRAIQRATQARNAVIDCRASGGVWDQGAGECRRR